MSDNAKGTVFITIVGRLFTIAAGVRIGRPPAHENIGNLALKLVFDFDKCFHATFS